MDTLLLRGPAVVMASAVRKWTSLGTDGQGHQRRGLGGLQSKLNQNVYLLDGFPAASFSLQRNWPIYRLCLDFGHGFNAIPLPFQTGAKMLVVSSPGASARHEGDKNKCAHPAETSVQIWYGRAAFFSL